MQETSPPGGRGKKGSSSRTKGASRSQRAGPKKGGKRRPLTLEAIVDTAVRIADEEGLDAVSIRRVAAELDARPMSLYDHIPSKDDLISEMANKVVAEVLLERPIPDDWREALTKISQRLYATLVGHAWLPMVLPRRPRLGPNEAKQAEQLATAMASVKLDPAEIWTLVATVNDYVLGHSLRAALAPQGIDLEEAIPTGDLVETPELAALPDWLRTRASVERFEAGLRIVLDGIEQRIVEAGE